MGQCGVCGKHKSVTETRDYGYLRRGINALKQGETLPFVNEAIDKARSKTVGEAMRAAEPFSNLTKDFTPERKVRIKEQSKEVAEHMLTLENTRCSVPEDEETLSYTIGDIACCFTEDEVVALKDMLEFVEEHEEYELDEPCKDVINKVFDLYDDHCVKYQLSPALKKFHELYGTFGAENEEEDAKWVVFRDAFHAGFDHAKETK
jgi:hypothetical protein